MASEKERHCGYRKHGGIYIVGSGLTMTCDRLPIPLEVCPVCNEGLKFNRNPRQIDAFKMFDKHEIETPIGQVPNQIIGQIPCEEFPHCYVCNPPSGVPSYIMGVGEPLHA